MLSESELDAILASHGGEYNRPPHDPPLEFVREKVFVSRERTRRSRVAIFGIGVAAAAAIIVLSVAPAPEARRDAAVSRHADPGPASTVVTIDARTESANRVLIEAVRSAELAAAAHPDDPYFAEHLETMTENAEHFQKLQRDQLGANP
jgi:hypothetical protein